MTAGVKNVKYLIQCSLFHSILQIKATKNLQIRVFFVLFCFVLFFLSLGIGTLEDNPLLRKWAI
jgi:succinate-acetate transporter protein